MRRYLSIVILLATVTLSQFGCASPQSNTAPTNTNMAVTEATPDKAAIEAELIKIENDWPRIIKERDAAAVRRLEADDAIFVYPDGSTGGKDQDVKDVESGATTAESWEVSDIKVNVLDKDSAIVSVRITVKGGKYKTPDGRAQDISGQYRSIDTFSRRNGQWQLVAYAMTPVKNPEPAASPSPTPKASPSPGASPAMKATPAAKGTTPPKPSPAAKASPAMKPAATPVKVAPRPATTP